MSDDSASGRNATPSTNSHARTGLLIAVIGLVAAVAGPLVPVLVARSDDASGPSSSGTVAVSTATTAKPTHTGTSDPSDTSDNGTKTTAPPSTVEKLTSLIASGQGSLANCSKYDTTEPQPLAAVKCDTTTSDSLVPYVYSFESQSDLDDWMAGEVDLYGTPDGSRCKAAGTWTGPWSYRGATVGELTCGWFEDSYSMSWTYPDQLLAVSVMDTDAAALYAWWDSVPLIF